MMIATANPSRATAVHPLRNQDFRLLWAGRTISYLGDQFYLVALPWLILQLTSSSVTLGTIMMTATVPSILLMLVGGAFSDRFSPRRIMLSTTSARSICVALLGVLVWNHVLHLWEIYLLALVFGVADAFAGPASQTLLPSIVKPEQLPAANSITQVTQQLTSIVGQAPAGLAVKALGLAWAFFIDAISFLFVIAALWRLPDPPRAPGSAGRKGVMHSIAQGLTYVGGDVELRSLLLILSALNFCIAGPVSLGLAWIAKQTFGSPVAFSIFIVSVSAGSLAGALLAGLYKPQRRGLAMILVSALIAVATGLMGFLTQIWSFAFVLLAMGVCAGFLNVHILAWFQARVQREMLGRAVSVLMFASVGLAPLSLLFAGLALTWNLTAMFVISASLILVVTAAAAAQQTVRDIR